MFSSKFDLVCDGAYTKQYSEAERKAKREWASRNREHVKENFKSWYEKNKEALSIKRKAQRDTRKTLNLVMEKQNDPEI